MSRADEDRILHGLYYLRESIDEDMVLSGEQILWLATHPLPAGAGWARSGRPQSLDASAFPEEIRSKLLTAKLDLPLRYLQYRRLIKYLKRPDSKFVVAVTFAGADRAIRLHTRRGRLDLAYREHREGLLGISATVLVAFITSVLTVFAVLRLLRF